MVKPEARWLYILEIMLSSVQLGWNLSLDKMFNINSLLGQHWLARVSVLTWSWDWEWRGSVSSRSRTNCYFCNFSVSLLYCSSFIVSVSSCLKHNVSFLSRSCLAKKRLVLPIKYNNDRYGKRFVICRFFGKIVTIQLFQLTCSKFSVKFCVKQTVSLLLWL